MQHAQLHNQLSSQTRSTSHASRSYSKSSLLSSWGPQHSVHGANFDISYRVMNVGSIDNAFMHFAAQTFGYPSQCCLDEGATTRHRTSPSLTTGEVLRKKKDVETVMNDVAQSSPVRADGVTNSLHCGHESTNDDSDDYELSDDISISSYKAVALQQLTPVPSSKGSSPNDEQPSDANDIDYYDPDERVPVRRITLDTCTCDPLSTCTAKVKISWVRPGSRRWDSHRSTTPSSCSSSRVSSSIPALFADDTDTTIDTQETDLAEMDQLLVDCNGVPSLPTPPALADILPARPSSTNNCALGIYGAGAADTILPADDAESPEDPIEEVNAIKYPTAIAAVQKKRNIVNRILKRASRPVARRGSLTRLFERLRTRVGNVLVARARTLPEDSPRFDLLA